MTDTLIQHEQAVRTAVSAGDFSAAGAALDAYAAELRRVVQATPDGATLAAIQACWKDLVGWARSMALTAREFARDEWIRLPVACAYRAPTGPHTSTINTRG